MEPTKEDALHKNSILLFAGLSTIFSFFTMLSTGYMAYVLFRLVEGLRNISEQLGK